MGGGGGGGGGVMVKSQRGCLVYRKIVFYKVNF